MPSINPNYTVCSHNLIFLSVSTELLKSTKLSCQEEWEQLLGAGQMKDRNSSNLSVELGDNQGAMEAAQALRDSSLVSES